MNARGDRRQVKRIELVGGVHVFVRLDTAVDLRAIMHTVQKQFRAGGHMIRIDEGSPAAEPVSLDMVLEGSSPAELMETATQTVQDIQRAPQ